MKVDWSTYDFSESEEFNDTLEFDSYEGMEIEEAGINIMDGQYCLLHSNYKTNDLNFDVEFCAGIPGKDAQQK